MCQREYEILAAAGIAIRIGLGLRGLFDHIVSEIWSCCDAAHAMRSEEASVRPAALPTLALSAGGSL